MNLYEQQSTYNPNMPLRFLMYYSKIIEDIVKENEYNVFGRSYVKIPTPKFVVFYNGAQKRTEKEVMYLSDSYEHKQDSYELELSCTVYNINPNNNGYITKKSEALSGYMSFIEKVRSNLKTCEINDAVEMAINWCIDNNILSDLMKDRRERILEMTILDFTHERQLD